MKKILVIILCAYFIIVLTGCRNSVKKDISPETDSSPSQTDTTASQTDTTASQTDSDNSLDIKDNSSDSPSVESNSTLNSTVDDSNSKKQVSSKTDSSTSSEKEKTVKNNEYTITFDFGYDGKIITVQTVNHDAIAVAPDVPSRPGYKFFGWYNGDQQLTRNNRTVNCDTTFVGLWATPSSRIFYNFDPDGLLAARDIYIKAFAVPYDSDKTNWGSINSPAHPQNISMREYYIHLPSTYDFETETFTIDPIIPENLSYYDRDLDKDSSTFGFLTEFEFIGWTYGDKTIPEKAVTIPKGSEGSYHFVAHWQPKKSQ